MFFDTVPYYLKVFNTDVFLANYSVYPNPTSKYITFRKSGTEQTESGYIEIYNQLGKFVYSNRINENLTTDLEVLNIHYGMYILRMIENGNMQVEKVLYIPE